MRKVKGQEDLLIFKEKYESNSGLELPIEYLDRSNVYVFVNKKEIIAGFILGQTIPLRTIELFSSEHYKQRLTNDFSKEIYCEVCCFWIDQSHRKSQFNNLMIWLKMAYTVKKQSKRFIVFGTNSRGLAELYGYPKNSLLLHKDRICNRDTFIFLARRTDFANGVWEIVLSKLFKKARSKEIMLKSNLKDELLYEMSIN